MKKWVLAALAAVGVTVVLLPAAADARRQAAGAAPGSVTITQYVRWTGRTSCPPAEKTKTKRVVLPAAGRSLTLVFTGEIPNRCGAWSIGVKQYAPALPINITETNEVTYPNADECRTTPVPCKYVFTLTLTAGKGCECKSLRAGGRGGVNLGDPDLQGRTHLRLTLRWVMVCSTGPFECKGEFELGLPEGWTALTPAGGTAGCKGRCSVGGPSTHAGDVKLHAVVSGYGADARAGKALRVGLKTFCNAGADRKQVGRGTILIAFDRRGLVDTKRSDLNADGRPDGR